MFMPKEALGAEPAELLSQSGRWLVELYLLSLNFFRVEFLIHLGRRQAAPVKLGFRAGTCYVSLSLNVGYILTEILLNVWRGMPDGDLTYEEMVQLDRHFSFNQEHVDRIRKLFELEFGFKYSIETDRMFEEVRIGIQQERAALAPFKDGDTSLLPRAIRLAGEGGDDTMRRWLGESASTRQVWSVPASPSEWAKRFAMSWDTLKARIADGNIRAKRLSSKSYRIHVDDLPKPTT